MMIYMFLLISCRNSCLPQTHNPRLDTHTHSMPEVVLLPFRYRRQTLTQQAHIALKHIE